MHRVRSVIEQAGVNCTTRLIKNPSPPYFKTTLDYANEIDSDMIIIMTQQETDPIEYFISSAAQEILNNSDIPVMCINPSGMFTNSIWNDLVDPFGLKEK
jgi:nucleotide-binding universal stress UspA family protein